MREYDRYRGFYCGLCRSLKERHGNLSRLTLNYDMNFLVLFLTSLYEPEVAAVKRRCAVHPFAVHEELSSPVSGYAADMNVLLARYNMLDDWEDDRNIVKGAAAALLSRRARVVENRYPRKAEKIREHLAELKRSEKAREEDIEVPAGIFGRVMGEVFTYDETDPMRDSIYACGMQLGKFVYIMDAYEDMEEDRRKGEYNGLLDMGEEKIKELLELSMSACAREFETLPVIDDIEIMRNILYAGCWSRYEEVKKKRKQ